MDQKLEVSGMGLLITEMVYVCCMRTYISRLDINEEYA